MRRQRRLRTDTVIVRDRSGDARERDAPGPQRGSRGSTDQCARPGDGPDRAANDGVLRSGDGVLGRVFDEGRADRARQPGGIAHGAADGVGDRRIAARHHVSERALRLDGAIVPPVAAVGMGRMRMRLVSVGGGVVVGGAAPRIAPRKGRVGVRAVWVVRVVAVGIVAVRIVAVRPVSMGVAVRTVAVRIVVVALRSGAVAVRVVAVRTVIVRVVAVRTMAVRAVAVRTMAVRTMAMALPQEALLTFCSRHKAQRCEAQEQAWPTVRHAAARSARLPR